MIKSLKATNFLSWQSLDFDFKQGVTLIEGWNHDDSTPEGSGKSAILNALCWGLYGGIPKDAKTDDVLREGAKSCSVEIELESGVKIIRSRKPNDLWIVEPRSTDKIKGKDAKETQTLIEGLLGLTFETFCQAIYFAQNYPNKFVTANEADKAKILSEIQDLSVFDKARKEVVARSKALELEEFSLKKDISHIVQAVEALESKIQDFEKLKAAAVRERKEGIEALKFDLKAVEADAAITRESIAHTDERALGARSAELQEDDARLKEERAKLKTQLAGLEDVKRLKQRLESQVTKLTKDYAVAKAQPAIEVERFADKETQVSKLKDEQKEAKKTLKAAQKALENPEKSNCPTCQQPWDGNVSHYEREVKKAESLVQRLAQQEAFLDKELTSILGAREAAWERIPTLKTELALVENDLAALVVPDSRELESSIAELSEALKELAGLQFTVHTQLNDYARSIQSLGMQEKRLQEMQAQLAKQEEKTTAQFDEKLNAASGELVQQIGRLEQTDAELGRVRENLGRMEELKQGFKDVKSFVFQGLLEELNRKANRYLNDLFEQPVRIKFGNQVEGGDISKIEVEVSIDGQTRSLGLLSGGQFKRVELATNLALSDIVAERGDRPFNLLILDESMKDLSETSMERVLHLLEQRKGSVLLIEHNSIFKSVVSNVYKVELVDGISRRVE